MRIAHTFSIAFAMLLLGCGTESMPEPDSSAEDAPQAEPSADAAAEPELSADAAPEPNDETLCIDMGPQTPRDISNTAGLNPVTFPFAPPASEMNLCNLHTHTNAEHRGPEFSVFVSDADDGGYACDAAADLSEAELAPAEGAYRGVEPGDTIEVHWVHTTCAAMPGEGLGACVPDTCSDPLLRVEAQVFLAVNDPDALDFTAMAYGGNVVDDLHQAQMIPATTGEPVVFRGSTTGPSYDQSTCSAAQVTWSVRPQCARLDIDSLYRWAEQGNVFNETGSHGVRQLVTAPELLAPIE